MRDISRNLKTIGASNAALVNLEEDLRTAVSQGTHTHTHARTHTHTLHNILTVHQAHELRTYVASTS